VEEDPPALNSYGGKSCICCGLKTGGDLPPHYIDTINNLLFSRKIME
jgi:hypothetical protein